MIMQDISSTPLKMCFVKNYNLYEQQVAVNRAFVSLFPNTPFWDCPKFKKAADNNWNVAIKGFLDTDCIENVGKGKLLILSIFTLFHNVFLKVFFMPPYQKIGGGGGILFYPCPSIRLSAQT